MKKFMIMGAVIVLAPFLVSFCGFYVSKADGALKNKTSQVILVRDGNKNVITMYNDFKGDSKDFAMVVPVPVVLQKSDIKVVKPDIFTKLNDYSAPRLVEYWDQNPCRRYDEVVVTALAGKVAGLQINMMDVRAEKKKSTVKIEAQYLVGEYDILILSAKESNGLKDWLNDNGYKIPANAEEVLEPYIKSNMKFFVVKVNEKEKKKLNNNFLSPIQISFRSARFMLPIRLGMANADGDQDLVVYAFTRKGRIECTNYRNQDVATGKNIPLFIQKNFGAFYSNLFSHQWAKENKSVAFLEYAWNVTPVNQMKCDPCVGNPPTVQDLVQSGVWWLNGKDWNDYSDVDDEEFYSGNDRNVHFTRLHFRYNRKSFPQDLSFQVTPNQENFQARYIITHPADGNFDCEAGKKYMEELKLRRRKELKELMALTGTNPTNWEETIDIAKIEEAPGQASYAGLINQVQKETASETKWPGSFLLIAGLTLAFAGVIKWTGLI